MKKRDEAGLHWQGRVLAYQNIWLCQIERYGRGNVLIFSFGAYGGRGYFPLKFPTIAKARETAEEWAVKFAVPEHEAAERWSRRTMRGARRKKTINAVPQNAYDDDEIPF